MWQICPHCGQRSDDAVCADDGVPTEKIRASTQFPGRLQNGYMLRDQYRIDGMVGVGGMGVVYRAVHSITHQPVAIKVLWRDLADNPQEVRRFTREARAASVLTHPNTVRVYDFGRDEPSDSIYMVMEYLVGRKLSDLLAEQPVLEPTRAVHIAAQVCKSLEEAHGKGIVHRDLKPDNIFLQDVAGEKDFVKVLDFGLAKFVTGDFERDNLTKTGYVVGSPEYMAPEQAIGSNVGPQADLYSLGIVLYEILTGDLPFDAVSTAQVLRKHIMDRVPDMPEDVRHSIPPKLQSVVMRCLEKDANDRPPSAEVLRIHLLQAQDRRRRGPSEPVVRAARRKSDLSGAHLPSAGVAAPGAVASAVVNPETQSMTQPTPAPEGVIMRRKGWESGGVQPTTPTPPNGETTAAVPPRDLAAEVTQGLPDDQDEAALRRLVEQESEPQVSGWMLVGIGIAAAVAVLAAAILTK
ncbi:MAG: serine/threonine protein kinase [Myxococcales bacterium]|nr:serine/threonine protein kinase [Myxococcales bacterium]